MQWNKAVVTSLVLAGLLGATTTAMASDDKVDAANAEMHGIKANIANGEKIFKEGKGEVPACNSCHGPEGMGDDNLGTPRLANQQLPFLIKQLEDFAHDRRTDTTMSVMNNNAKGLTPQDRVDVAAYVSTKLTITSTLSNLKDLSAAGTVVGATHLGKSIVQFGIPEKGVPACQSCHGYNGRGVDPVYPQIGRQKYVYLMNQLKKWRDGTRANDPMSQMQHVAQKLSDEDMANAAAYLAGASFYSLGNPRLPEQHLPYLEAH